MMRNERNGWMELLPSENNQKQPIGLDRLQFTAMRIVMDHNDDDGDDDDENDKDDDCDDEDGDG